MGPPPPPDQIFLNVGVISVEIFQNYVSSKKNCWQKRTTLCRHGIQSWGLNPGGGDPSVLDANYPPH